MLVNTLKDVLFADEVNEGHVADQLQNDTEMGEYEDFLAVVLATGPKYGHHHVSE